VNENPSCPIRLRAIDETSRKNLPEKESN